jgi:hypothetical protein
MIAREPAQAYRQADIPVAVRQAVAIAKGLHIEGGYVARRLAERIDDALLASLSSSYPGLATAFSAAREEYAKFWDLRFVFRAHPNWLFPSSGARLTIDLVAFYWMLQGNPSLSRDRFPNLHRFFDHRVVYSPAHGGLGIRLV